jgi:hypothetical protein
MGGGGETLLLIFFERRESTSASSLEMPLQFEFEASCTEKSMKLKRVMAGKSARLKTV